MPKTPYTILQKLLPAGSRVFRCIVAARIAKTANETSPFIVLGPHGFRDLFHKRKNNFT